MSTQLKSIKKHQLSKLTLAIGAILASAPSFASEYMAYTVADAYVKQYPPGAIVSPWDNHIYDLNIDSTTSASSNNSGGKYSGYQTSSWAQADLTSATLKTYSSVTSDGSGQISELASARSSASIGDTFSFSQPTNTTPYIWGVNDTATFSVHIDGNSSNTTSYPQNTIVSLTLYSPNNIYSSGSIIGYAQWDYSNEGPTSQYNGAYTWIDSTKTTPISISSTGNTINSGYDISFSIGAKSDFSWRIDLSSTASIGGNITGANVADFSHTLTANFTGPSNALVSSASGAFPLAATVPEPETYATMILGLSVLGLIRKKRATA